ncbi:MAG: glucosamine-6-phosphate deaminase [Trueperaceae bacterium]|nr:MAG: glucosamine-6-phosphate deaminase [Trueperaceae bacterium]
MEIIIRPTPAHAAKLVARLVANRVRAKPELVLGCATGRTMDPVYAELVAAHRSGGLDLSRITTFNLDEYVGLAPDDERSYHHYMRTHLFEPVGLAPERTNLPNGSAHDLAGEARAYEARIAAHGGIDLQLLGLGVTGHIGFNEPLSSLMSRTREKALAPETRQQNAGLFGGDAEAVPKRALTMGVGTILDAREIVMLVTGETKADVLAAATEGPITARISATALQLHPRCIVVADEAAARSLEGTSYYRFLYAEEPEWAPYRDDPEL